MWYVIHQGFVGRNIDSEWWDNYLAICWSALIGIWAELFVFEYFGFSDTSLYCPKKWTNIKPVPVYYIYCLYLHNVCVNLELTHSLSQTNPHIMCQLRGRVMFCASAFTSWNSGVIMLVSVAYNRKAMALITILLLGIIKS